MERICALLCLTSNLECREGDPKPFGRRHVRAMLRAGALNGMLLRKRKGIGAATISRAEALLSRAPEVFAHVQAYLSQGYQVLLEGDECWPSHLYKLGKEMPLYLFLRGNCALLWGKKASVAGSRKISSRTRMRAAAVGQVLAQKKLTLVTGGAWGVDHEATKAALGAGGNVIVIPAVSASRLFAEPILQSACEAGRLLLLCETPPDEPFSSAKALTRNHTIYALGDVAMVIAARQSIGGTWSGARACLKNAWSPLFVLDEDGMEYAGNEALIDMGAHRMQIIREGAHTELIMQELDEAAIRMVNRRTQENQLERQISMMDLIDGKGI